MLRFFIVIAVRILGITSHLEPPRTNPAPDEAHVFDLALSEKGFYGMSFTLALFAAIAVQKNTRDLKLMDTEQESE